MVIMMKDEIKEYLRENPDYIDVLEDVIEYEEDNKREDHPFVEDKEYDSFWSYSDVGIDPNTLYQLEVNGISERVFDSNSNTSYSLIDRDACKDALDEVNEVFEDGFEKAMHDFPDEEELEDIGVFDDVVGYEDVKFLFRRAMSGDDIVNIVMFGPPGSAKTVFLMCINKLQNSAFTSGKTTSGPGFIDLMFDEKPRYMAIDELDNMSKEDQKALSDYTSEGILVETKGNNKKRKLKTNTKTFASANRPDDVLEEIENRFVDLHFDPYTHDEFVEVCEHILPRNEDKTEEESRQIAEAIWDLEGRGNVRKAVQAARLSRGDPKKVLGILDDYSSDSDTVLGI